MGCINFFPSPLPDETLYSVAARYHFMSGNTTSTETCKSLFGNHNGGLLHDFPSGINIFSQCTGCMDGNPQEIMQRLTILPYFEPFVPVSTITLVKEALLANQSEKLKFFLCLPPSMVEITHPLKACPACISVDIASTGFPYWHRTHQLPGVLMCPEHQCPLLISPCKINRLSKRQYLLPTHIDQAQPLLESEIISFKNEKLLINLAVEAQYFLRENLPSFNPIALRKTYLYGLKRQEWLSNGGNVRQREFQQAFVSHYAPLCNIPCFAPLLASIGGTDTWLSSLVRKQRGSKHPLKHLLLIVFLFGNVRQFIESHSNSKEALGTQKYPMPLQFKKGTNEVMRSKLVELLVDKKLSLRKASQVMGLSVSTLSVKAKRANISIRQHSFKRSEAAQNAILDDLSKGTPLRQVEINHGISNVSLNRFLRSNPEIQEAWIHKNFEIKREKKRIHFLTSLRALPILSCKTIAQSPGTGFKWLYRNDKKWLETQMPAPLSKKTYRKPRVDWTVRDQALASEILGAVSMLGSPMEKPRRISKTALFRLVPDLGKKSTLLIKMPRTAIALQQSVETKEAYRSRRLAWARRELERTAGIVKSYQVRRLAGIQSRDEGD